MESKKEAKRIRAILKKRAETNHKHDWNFFEDGKGDGAGCTVCGLRRRVIPYDRVKDIGYNKGRSVYVLEVYGNNKKS